MSTETKSNSIPDVTRTELSPTELSTDDDNPNEMSERQLDALEKNIRRFGFLVPVIVNRDYVVADGEHRLQVAKDLGLDNIPVVVVDANDPDRRIIRQVMNKLKGSHTIQNDAEEFDKILESRPKDDFSELLGRSEKSIDGVLTMLDDGDGNNTNELIDEVESHPASDENSKTGDDTDEYIDTDSGTPAESEDLGEPDEIDMTADEFDHECPNCGYEW